MTINDEALKGRPKNPRKKNPKNHYGKIAWRIFRFFISPFQGFAFSYALFTQGGAIPFGNRFPWAPLRSRRWRFATRYAFAYILFNAYGFYLDKSVDRISVASYATQKTPRCRGVFTYLFKSNKVILSS
jgi:hypothetical protein